MTDPRPSIARPTGCRCHIEAGDSACPVHPPDPVELAYAASIGAPYLNAGEPPMRYDVTSLLAEEPVRVFTPEGLSAIRDYRKDMADRHVSAADQRPSIAELQRFCHDDAENHDADLALAAPVLLEIAAAAREVQQARLEYRNDQGVTCHRLGRAHDALDAALSKVRP